jgi:hypothetical protein
MKATDLIVLLASLTGALLLLQYSTRYQIEPLFKMPLLSPRLVRISDVDGDGKQEVLAVRHYTEDQTTSTTLRHVLTVFAVNSSLHVTRVKQLPAQHGQPLLLTSGSFRAGSPEHVIVVTSRAEILCYNHVLDLVWSSTLALDSTSPHLHVTALVTHKSLRKFDEGAVVVCARDQSEHVTGDSTGWQCRALDGRTGAIRWEFNEHDEHVHDDRQHDTRVKMSDVNWKIQRAMAGRGHVDQDVNCQSFTPSLYGMQAQNGTSDPMHGLQVHRWYESADTILALVGLARNKLSGVPPANTLVLHHVEGMQLLHYYTGLPLCHVTLAPRQLHVDLNHDNTLESVHVAECQLSVETALVSHARQLFNYSVCQRGSHVPPLSSAPLLYRHAGASHVAVLSSDGELRAVNSHGAALWHVTLRELREVNIVPQLHVVPATTLLLAVQGQRVALVDGVRGEHVTSVRMDEHVTDLQLGDVTGDDVADLLVFSETQLAGYALTVRDALKTHVFTVALLALWLIVFAALFYRLNRQST